MPCVRDIFAKLSNSRYFHIREINIAELKNRIVYRKVESGHICDSNVTIDFITERMKVIFYLSIRLLLGMYWFCNCFNRCCRLSALRSIRGILEPVYWCQISIWACRCWSIVCIDFFRNDDCWGGKRGKIDILLKVF